MIIFYETTYKYSPAIYQNKTTVPGKGIKLWVYLSGEISFSNFAQVI